MVKGRQLTWNITTMFWFELWSKPLLSGQALRQDHLNIHLPYLKYEDLV